MKIIFFGSSNFGAPLLDILHKKEDVVLVVTQPDRKSGRGLKTSFTPIKALAQKLDIKIYQPENINSAESIEYLSGFGADIFVVVSFGQILSKDILAIPRLYSLNLHASLLPKYRGAAPINWAILNGDKITGLSVIRMDERMDEGDIALQEKIEIYDEDDAVTLSDKLSQHGAILMVEAIRLIREGNIVFKRQDPAAASYAPRLKKEDGLIDWNLKGEDILRRIRAFVPWPGCFTYFNGRMLKIWKARPGPDFLNRDGREAPGTVLEVDRGIFVSTGKGVIEIEELQIEGKRRMKSYEFIIGHTRDLRKGLILG